MTRRRVDPRAERVAATVMVGGRPRRLRTPPVPADESRRRDPRAVRAAALVRSHPRPLYDWTCKTAAPAPEVAVAGASSERARDLSLRVVAEPAFLVLAVLDCADGTVSDHDRAVVAAGRLLADGGGGAVVTVAAIDGAALTSSGSDRHVALPASLADAYCPEARADMVAALMAAHCPRHVLFPDTPDGGDVARRVSAATGERLFAGVASLSPERAGRPSRGGSVELMHAPPRLMTLAADTVPPLEDARHEARPMDAPEIETSPRLADARRLRVDPDALALGEADFLISAGNGVTDWAAFTELAGRLGATRAGTRVVCDDGHLPRSRQVGASGTVVTAHCYLAFGIAGAPQHLQGIPGVRHVIAVNTDLHAAMIKRADLAVVADAQAVMPALIRHIRERRHD